jgi:hypothetical protein
LPGCALIGHKEIIMNLKHMIAVTSVGLSTAFAPVMAHAAPISTSTSHAKPAAKRAHKAHKKAARVHHKPAPKIRS